MGKSRYRKFIAVCLVSLFFAELASIFHYTKAKAFFAHQRASGAALLTLFRRSLQVKSISADFSIETDILRPISLAGSKAVEFLFESVSCV